MVIPRQNWTQKRVFLLCKQQRPTCQFLWQEREKTIFFGAKYLVNLRTQESRAPAGCAWGWHSPDGLQAPLDGLGGDEARGRVVDLMGQAEAHLQPAVDVEPHHTRCAQAAESGPSATHTAAPSRAHKPLRPPGLPRKQSQPRPQSARALWDLPILLRPCLLPASHGSSRIGCPAALQARVIALGHTLSPRCPGVPSPLFKSQLKRHLLSGSTMSQAPQAAHSSRVLCTGQQHDLPSAGQCCFPTRIQSQGALLTAQPVMVGYAGALRAFPEWRKEKARGTCVRSGGTISQEAPARRTVS